MGSIRLERGSGGGVWMSVGGAVRVSEVGQRGKGAVQRRGRQSHGAATAQAATEADAVLGRGSIA